ncbi:MAG: Gfo/Idh/MocA family oxidoreductase [Clostridia bacterium]|nr:Gfo/Idh/MocA family oxidoreductase [Clostridia bacterium]
MKKVKVLVAGCGSRGSNAYGKIMERMPDQYEVVGIAEPIDSRRNDMKRRFNLSEEVCFLDWKDMAAQPKFADMVVIATQDYMHREPALAFIEKGYDILLEKPMAPTPKECMEIVEAAKKHNTKILVCHVLRYTKFFKTLKQMISDGLIGDVQVINHQEDVGHIHQSHSFVRGNWRNSEETTPMILAKCCHDTDLLQWLVGSKCKKVQSFGSLSHFNAKNAPEGAPDRCTDGCPHGDTCFYNAIKLYHEHIAAEWMVHVCGVNPNATDEDIMEQLRTGPYGRCVYKCDNDVVDHQTVNMEFENGETVTLTMTAFTKGGRHTRIMGTKGEIEAHAKNDYITVYTFDDRQYHEYKIADYVGGNTIASGHGGGDGGIMEALYEYITDTYEGFSICDIETSAMNHLISFAAEESRVNGGTVIDLDEYAKKVTE